MIIHKNIVYVGDLQGRTVHVMPVAVSADDVCFNIGSPFGNRIWFDGTRQDSMRRAEFEHTFKPAHDENKGGFEFD